MTDAEFQIKPEKGAAKLDTSEWPLLLKVNLILSYNIHAFPLPTRIIVPKNDSNLSLNAMATTYHPIQKKACQITNTPTINTISIFSLISIFIFVAIT